MMITSFDSPGISAVRLTIFFSPSGVVAVNSSVLTAQSGTSSAMLMMYSRVFASSGEPGMRGPISTCFFTWSIARSPLNATAAGTTGLASFRDAPKSRCADVGCGASLGQPVKRNDKREQAQRRWSIYSAARAKFASLLIEPWASNASYTVIEAKRKNVTGSYVLAAKRSKLLSERDLELDRR